MASRLSTPAFSLGDTVYQRASPETGGGMVTGILYRPGGGIIYMVTWGVSVCADETNHWECELTTERGFTVPGSEDGDS